MHAHCFTCSLCSRGILSPPNSNPNNSNPNNNNNGEYVQHPSQPGEYLHKQCYLEKFSRKCAKCLQVCLPGEPVFQLPPSSSTNNNNHNQVSVSGNNGNNGNSNVVHARCFTCTHCHQQLSGGRFFEKHDKQYHQECFENLFSPKCDKCHSRIGMNTQYHKYSPTSSPNEEERYHSECFRCSLCDSQLGGGAFKYLSRGRFLCVLCVGREDVAMTLAAHHSGSLSNQANQKNYNNQTNQKNYNNQPTNSNNQTNQKNYNNLNNVGNGGGNVGGAWPAVKVTSMKGPLSSDLNSNSPPKLSSSNLNSPSKQISPTANFPSHHANAMSSLVNKSSPSSSPTSQSHVKSSDFGTGSNGSPEREYPSVNNKISNRDSNNRSRDLLEQVTGQLKEMSTAAVSSSGGDSRVDYYSSSGVSSGGFHPASRVPVTQKVDSLPQQQQSKSPQKHQQQFIPSPVTTTTSITNNNTNIGGGGLKSPYRSPSSATEKKDQTTRSTRRIHNDEEDGYVPGPMFRNSDSEMSQNNVEAKDLGKLVPAPPPPPQEPQQQQEKGTHPIPMTKPNLSSTSPPPQSSSPPTQTSALLNEIRNASKTRLRRVSTEEQRDLSKPAFLRAPSASGSGSASGPASRSSRPLSATLVADSTQGGSNGGSGGDIASTLQAALNRSRHSLDLHRDESETSGDEW